jgi:predicted ribosome quality control (RQC) complex YloA/Tae2 family protein
MDQRRLRNSHPTEEVLQLVAEKRSRLIERATILKRQLRQLAAELTACEESIDELDRTEKHLLAENAARLRSEKQTVRSYDAQERGGPLRSIDIVEDRA